MLPWPPPGESRPLPFTRLAALPAIVSGASFPQLDQPAWTNANVYVILGPVSNLVRLDVDGDEGEAFLREQSGESVPPTLEFLSGGGKELPPAVAGLVRLPSDRPLKAAPAVPSPGKRNGEPIWSMTWKCALRSSSVLPAEESDHIFRHKLDA